MRFCKKLGRLVSLFPVSQWPESARETGGSHQRDGSCTRWGEVHEETKGCPSPGCGGRGELTVSAAALPESELMSGTRQLKNTNGSQTQGSKPGLQREVTMKRWQTTCFHVHTGHGLKRSQEWCSTSMHRGSGRVLIWWSWLHTSLGLSPEQAFQLCSPQTRVTSGRNIWHYGAWSQSCRFASHHLMRNIFKKKIRRGRHFHLVCFKNI